MLDTFTDNQTNGCDWKFYGNMHVSGSAGQELPFPCLRTVKFEPPLSARSHLYLLIGTETEMKPKKML